MERFFEMAIVFYIMSLIVNTLLITSSMPLALGGLGLNPVLIQATGTNVYTPDGVLQQTQNISIEKDENGIITTAQLPAVPTINTGNFYDAIIFGGSILISAPVVWYNLFSTFGFMADGGTGAVSYIFSMLGALISVICFLAILYILMILISTIRGGFV